MCPTARECAWSFTSIMLLLATATVARGAALDQLYWTEWDANAQNAIRRSNIDGGDLTTIASGSGGNVGNPPHYFGPVGIAVDMPAGYVYWADISGNKITRSNLDGSDPTTIGASTDPFALTLDTRHGKLYWSDETEDRIYMANLDGSQPQAIVTSGALYVQGLAVDSLGGKLYWTDVHTDSVKRADLDGTNVETLVSGYQYQAPSGLALDLTHGKMYWADWATYKIVRANLDGSSVEDFVAGLSHPGPLAIDPLSQLLYCLDWGSDRMLRVDLSTRDIVTIATRSGISSLSGIAYARVPEPGGGVLLLIGVVSVLSGRRLQVAWGHRS